MTKKLSLFSHAFLLSDLLFHNLELTKMKNFRQNATFKKEYELLIGQIIRPQSCLRTRNVFNSAEILSSNIIRLGAEDEGKLKQSSKFTCKQQTPNKAITKARQ